MNLTCAVQLEYAILESLVKNGQKDSMSLAISTSEFLESFCKEDCYDCSQKWKDTLGLVNGEIPENLSEFKSCQEFFDFVTNVYTSSNYEKRWELVAIAVSCLKLFVEINFTGRAEIKSDENLPMNWYDESFILDGGTICSVAKNVSLLVIARAILFVKNGEGK